VAEELEGGEEEVEGVHEGKGKRCLYLVCFSSWAGK
jgi:hypothetical protein